MSVGNGASNDCNSVFCSQLHFTVALCVDSFNFFLISKQFLTLQRVLSNKTNHGQRSEILMSCVGDSNHVLGWVTCLCVLSPPPFLLLLLLLQTLPENKRAHLEPEISSSKSALCVCVTALNIPEAGSERGGKCVHSSRRALSLEENHNFSFEGEKIKGGKQWILGDKKMFWKLGKPKV